MLEHRPERFGESIDRALVSCWRTENLALHCLRFLRDVRVGNQSARKLTMPAFSPLLASAARNGAPGSDPVKLLSFRKSRLYGDFQRHGVFVLDGPPAFPVRSIKFALRSRPWISCRVAEGRALRSHDNRIEDNFGRPVSTLALQRGNMRFGVRSFQHLVPLNPHSRE